jgi:putative sigma-54 modulation protein
MDLTFTGRGLPVTDEIRETATHKFSRLGRMEPRATGIDLELIAEHHPAPNALKRVEATLRTPRKTFRAHAEAGEVPAALDAVADKLERQLRDHHGKKRSARHAGGLESATTPAPPPE